MDDLEQLEYLFNNFYSTSVNYICINNGFNSGIINIKKPERLVLPSNYDKIIKKHSNEYKINNIEGKISHFRDLVDTHISSINDYPIIFRSIKCDACNSIIINRGRKIRYYKYEGLDLCKESYYAHRINVFPNTKMIEFDNYIYCVKCKKIYIPDNDPGINSDCNKNDERRVASSPYSTNDKSTIPHSFNKSVQCNGPDSMDSNNEDTDCIYDDVDTTGSYSCSRLYSHNKSNCSLFKESTNLGNNTGNYSNNLINYPNTILNDLCTDRSNNTFRKLLNRTNDHNNIIECSNHLYETNLTNIQYSCDMNGYGSMLDWIPILKKIYSYGYILLNCNPESINYGKIAFQKIDYDTDMDYIVFE